MLRVAFRSSSLRFPVCRAVPVSARHFSDDSHDDFKPKKKEVADDMREVLELIDKQVKEHPLLLFMKDFSSINVLEYPAIREGVKKYSDWPTIPQLYVKGEFVGGCDIITNMYKEGELETMLKEKKLIKE